MRSFKEQVDQSQVVDNQGVTTPPPPSKTVPNQEYYV